MLDKFNLSLTKYFLFHNADSKFFFICWTLVWKSRIQNTKSAFAHSSNPSPCYPILSHAIFHHFIVVELATQVVEQAKQVVEQAKQVVQQASQVVEQASQIVEQAQQVVEVNFTNLNLTFINPISVRNRQTVLYLTYIFVSSKKN